MSRIAEIRAALAAKTKLESVEEELSSLCTLLGIENPNDYHARKCTEEGLPYPVGLVDPHSIGRKLVSMLGGDWTWGAVDDGETGKATVFCKTRSHTVESFSSDRALLLAALEAMT